MDVVHLTGRNDASVVNRVISLLRHGGVAAVPTDTVYGLIADISRESAVKKVFRIKARSHAKALPVFVRNITEARHYAYIDTNLAKFLPELWPGSITIVLRKKPTMPDLVTGGVATVGLRVPNYAFLNRVLEAFPTPLTATSANLSGSEPARSSTEVQNTFIRSTPRPDLIVDGGDLEDAPPSTVLDLTNPRMPKILRVGATTPAKLLELLAHWEKT